MKQAFSPLNGVSILIVICVLLLGCGGSQDSEDSRLNASVLPVTSDGQSTLTSNTATAAAPVTTTSMGGVSSTMVKLSGNQIYNASGKRVVLRGPEITMASGSAISDIDTIAASGANGIRVLLTPDAVNNMTPAMFDQFFAKLAAHDMIAWVSFYTWNTGANYAIGASLGGGNFYSLTAPSGTGVCSNETPGPCYLAMWDRQWVKDLMKKYQANVIIDAMQEYIAPPGVDSGSDAGRAAWAAEAKTHIQFFRGRGYAQPLAIMSSFEGRDLSAIVEHGAAIAAADTVKVSNQSQVIFGWQAYWSAAQAPSFYPDWMGSRLLGQGQSITATQAINTILPKLPFPVQVGFDNYSGDTNRDYGIQMDAAAAQKVSWLWWDWRNGQLGCPMDGDTCRTRVIGSQSGFSGARLAHQ